MTLNSLLHDHPVLLAFLATMFTWLVTASGAALVYFFKTIHANLLSAMLGFPAGVMIAASIWSLLLPAIEMSASTGKSAWFPALRGFLLGGFTLLGIDKLLPHVHPGLPTEKAEGIKTSWQRSVLLITAITLHNIPESLAVGVAFGALTIHQDISVLTSAIVLALGIGLQNFPEGAAVSIPLRREGFSRNKAFFYGQLSGVVEPIAGILGALLVTYVSPVLPYALSFAAGAMMFVVIEEIIPESQRGLETDYSTVGAFIGFSVMMLLDVSLS